MTGSRSPVDGASDARSPGIVWEPRAGVFGLVLALPAVLVGLFELAPGLALAAGVLPAAGAGPPAHHRGRQGTLAIGILAGGCLLLGSVLALQPVVAVCGLFALGPAGAWAATRFRGGAALMFLCPPFVGIGLSLAPALGAAAAVLMSAGSVYAFVLARLWPDQPGAGGRRRSPPVLDPSLARGYGVCLGIVGATAAAIGFALELEHVGWLCGAALLVMRPSAGVVLQRAAGRAVSVTLGALVAAGVSVAGWPSWVVLAIAAGAIVALAGARKSRWYIAPGFTTLVVFLLLLAGHEQDAQLRFSERVLETVLGVALALALGVALPWLWQRLRGRRQTEQSHP